MPENLYAPSKDLFGYSLRYVVDELKWEKFHIVAHSMGNGLIDSNWVKRFRKEKNIQKNLLLESRTEVKGTFIAAPYACIFPDQVETLTLVDFPGYSYQKRVHEIYEVFMIVNSFSQVYNQFGRK